MVIQQELFPEPKIDIPTLANKIADAARNKAPVEDQEPSEAAKDQGWGTFVKPVDVVPLEDTQDVDDVPDVINPPGDDVIEMNAALLQMGRRDLAHLGFKGLRDHIAANRAELDEAARVRRTEAKNQQAVIPLKPGRPAAG